jgi:ABC-type uncharacterized transport system ATPase subunit
MAEPLVELRGIVKRFPGVVANDHVDLELRAGEVHVLLGENGAGKTTLVRILAGWIAPDEGELLWRGTRITPGSAKEARRLGIAMVPQHPLLVPSLTVWENIALAIKAGPLLGGDAISRRIEEVARRYGLPVNPRARVWQLSMGERQRVELLRALLQEPRLLILDEPTTSLSPSEVKGLLALLRRMAEEGRAVVLITHKLEEALEAGDRISVMRAGRRVGTYLRGEIGAEELARLMVGELPPRQAPAAKPQGDEVVLEASELWVRADRGGFAVRGVSLSVKRGEALALVGVAGNGQHELAEALAGLRRCERGRIMVRGRDLTNRPRGAFVREGVAYVPEDRLGQGVIPSLSVLENLMLYLYRRRPFCKGPLLNLREMEAFCRRALEQFGISAPGLSAPASTLSGGNLQKLILARELLLRPRLLIAEHPTKGLDVRSTRQIQELLLRAKEQGTAIVLITEDLTEAVELAERIAVIFKGQVVGSVSPGGRAEELERIGLLMAGIRA